MQQFPVAALFDDVAVFHVQNGVGIPDGGQPVGNHEAGPPAHQLFHGLAGNDGGNIANLHPPCVDPSTAEPVDDDHEQVDKQEGEPVQVGRAAQA